MLTLSPSSIKTFCASKQKRAGKYILGVEDLAFSEDSLALGSLFENYLITKNDNYGILEGRAIDDMEKLIASYDNLKHNAIGLNMPIGDTQVKITGELFGVGFVGYIDNLHDNIPRDIKTAQYVTKIDNTSKNMWSGMTTYEEYELQMRIYMRLGGYKTSKIAEISKHKYKEEDRHEHQILEIPMTEEFDKKMTDKYEPIVKEMIDLYKKHSQI